MYYLLYYWHRLDEDKLSSIHACQAP
jgi:hypothetical protein